MLIKCIHHPLIYKSENVNEDRIQTLLMHLDDVITRGVLIVDDRNEIFQQVNNYIREWELDTQKFIQERIKYLIKVNRIKRVPMDVKSVNNTCDIIHYLLKNYDGVYMVPLLCMNHINNNGNQEIVTLNKYTSYNVYNKLKESVVVISSATDVNTFKNDIIKAIIEDCNIIKFYDRVFVNEVSKQLTIPENYKRSLKFIFDALKEFSTNQNINVEIYSSIVNNSLTEKAIEDTKEVLEQYIQQLEINYEYSIKIYVKLGYEKFSHSRHIITDIIGLSIDTGLDIIDKDDKIRNNIITIMKPEEIKKKEKNRTLKTVFEVATKQS